MLMRRDLKYENTKKCNKTLIQGCNKSLVKID